MENEPLDTGVNNAKVVSIVAYLSIVGWLIAYLLNNPRSEQASFHIRQALGVNLLFIASGLCFIVPILGWIVGAAGYVMGVVLWAIGIIFAIQEEEKEVPFLGKYFQEWFQGL